MLWYGQFDHLYYGTSIQFDHLSTSRVAPEGYDAVLYGMVWSLVLLSYCLKEKQL